MQVLPVRSSVCLSVPYQLLTSELKGAEKSKLARMFLQAGVMDVTVFSLCGRLVMVRDSRKLQKPRKP